ncbi:MAG: toprim domain-containing protein, partial [Desulfobacterales bacterium]|nr:toprim domain-containing protein [Desulfobacterales bacterium]
ILRSGVIAKGQRGPYDIFRERIIFPIFDRHSAPIAFGGRVMDKGEPKYLNSPDTPIFNKSETLYAFERAKEEIRRKDYAIVVEGYLDAIMCHQYGFINTVAPLGTALTPGHLKLISRLSRNVLLVFDGDRAGINAAKRSLGLIIEADMQGKVLVLPEGEDPDSILRTHGTDGMKGQIGR